MRSHPMALRPALLLASLGLVQCHDESCEVNCRAVSAGDIAIVDAFPALEVFTIPMKSTCYRAGR